MLAPEYFSSQEETDVEKEKTVHESQKKTRKIPIWEIIQTFENDADAEKSKGNEGSKCTKYDTALTMLQQLIYPAHTLLGANVLQYPGSAAALSPSAAQYGAGVYDFASQYNQAQLDAVNFPYGSQVAAAAGLGTNNQSNAAAANYAYAALAQQAIPSLTAAYQQ